MMRSLFSSLLCLLALASVTGCGSFRKSRPPKENPAISAEIETEFRQRWVDKRAGELTAQGVAADAARTQATKEFNERFALRGGATK